MSDCAPAPAPRRISVVTATCLVVANMIGTGVFTSLGFQVRDLPSGFAIVVLWLTGGVCALCGALAYGELAAALPRSGGEYHFLSAIFHRALGFLAGWVSVTVGFAAPIALGAMAFGVYFSHVVPDAPPTAMSLLLVVIVTAIHLRGSSARTLFQNSATLLKVILVLGLICAGVLFQPAQPISFAPTPRDFELITSAPFAVSLVYVMYAYSGWNASTYVIAEIERPARNVPLSLVAGTLFVTGLYVAVNAVFLRAAPLEELRGTLEVGHVAAKHIFGNVGGQIMAGLICAGLISSISAMTWVGPRVTMSMGEDWHLLRLLARKNPRGVPAIALLTQGCIVILLLLTSTFDIVLTYIQFSLTLCSFLTVFGVIVLRITRPELPRPYKAWGYPITPLLFLSVNGWMLWHIARERPWQSMAGFATLLIGLVFYFLSPRAVSDRNATGGAARG